MAFEDVAAKRPIPGAGVVVLCGPRAVLIRRAKSPRAGEWSLPGGRQEWGETIRETARREVLEETGLRPGPLHLLDVVDAVVREGKAVTRHFTLVDFWTEVAEAAASSARAGGDAMEVRWATLEEIDHLVRWSETKRICRLAFARRQMARD